MQTEVIRIIEGGLNGDRSKVFNYARTLAENLEAEGEGRFAKRIRSAISGKNPETAVLDGMALKPVDQESQNGYGRCGVCSASNDVRLVLSSYLQDRDSVSSLLSIPTAPYWKNAEWTRAAACCARLVHPAAAKRALLVSLLQRRDSPL